MQSVNALRFEPPDHPAACFCEVCKRNKPFDFPTTIANYFMRGEVALVVGAGVSTEITGLLPYTFYEEISHCISAGVTQVFPSRKLWRNFAPAPKVAQG